LSIRIWGKNLSEQHYYVNEQELAGSAGYFGSVAPPRTFGAEFGFKL
jgi:outer membrane receptor protein involved in Fe transport